MKDRIIAVKNWLLETSVKEKSIGVKNKFTGLSLIKKILFLSLPVVLGVGIWLLITKLGGSKTTYETATATKGVLVVSTSGSGTITSGNYSNITTKVSGTVKKVYVTNGDKVTKGQKLA
jgi:HlyD family secretion protein